MTARGTQSKTFEHSGSGREGIVAVDANLPYGNLTAAVAAWHVPASACITASVVCIDCPARIAGAYPASTLTADLKSLTAQS